ncbi:MAG: tRNA threonylcarbamoyladenosine dehydratase [Spirochaetae bacterium HGW-Spirochaetae-7]|jgi:tRNA A37 threonylcarbamoyladenosine dehydratase|nr:MAG: tRNA threonylcarbamoyladenosine dehydratase [Spirochaetae bacterium HGW-Spirochaetae-7]
MRFDDRTRILLGDAGADLLAASRVCVFGLGGVGATAAMDLVRAGVGSLVVVDFDTVNESNLNRLYFGYRDGIGKSKVDVFTEYARRVNPRIRIDATGAILRGATVAAGLPEGCGYYLDCIDTLNPKTNLMAALARAGLPFASSMGTAGRMAPERLRVGSLWETHDCPLSSLVRKRLRRFGFGPVPGELRTKRKTADETVSMPAEFLCVWSDEPPVAPAMPADGSIPGDTVDGERVRAVQGSGPFVPQAAGHIMASLAVRSLVHRLG